MAQFNYAANVRDYSPVKMMLEGRRATDQHKLAQQDIERGEITMPYVKQLTEQKVALQEQAIERGEIEKEFYKTQLEQDQTMRQQAIDAQSYALEEAESQKQFNEALRSGLYSDEELLAKYPIYGQQHYMKKSEAMSAMLDNMNESLAALRMSPPEERDARYQEMIRNAPPEIRDILPSTYDEQGLNDYLSYIRKEQKFREERLFQMWEEARAAYAANPTPENQEALDMIENMIKRSGLTGVGRGTAGERYAERTFGWAENPLAAAERYDGILSRIQREQSQFVREAFRKDDFADAMGRVDIQALRQNEPELYMEYMQEGYAQAIANLSNEKMAEGGMGDLDFFLYATKQMQEQTAPAGTVTPEPENVITAPPPEAAPAPAPRPPRAEAPGKVPVGYQYTDPATGITYEYVGGDLDDASAWREVSETGALSPWVRDAASGIAEGWKKTPFYTLTRGGD